MCVRVIGARWGHFWDKWSVRVCLEWRNDFNHSSGFARTKYFQNVKPKAHVYAWQNVGSRTGFAPWTIAITILWPRPAVLMALE